VQSGDVPFEVEFFAPASALAAFDIPVAAPPVKPKGGGKPKTPGKGKAPPKAKGGGKTSELSDFDTHQALVLEESGNTAQGHEDAEHEVGVVDELT